MSKEHRQVRDGAQSGSTEKTSRRAWAFERGRLWVIELVGEEQAPAPVPSVIPAVFGEARPELAEQLAQAMEISGVDPILQRFSSGRRCFTARVQGQIAAYCWISQAPECIGELDLEINIPDSEAYVWDCATLPAFRRKRLYIALLNYLIARLSDEGLERVWIGASLSNRPSQRAFARARFLPVISLFYVRLFSLGCMLVSEDPHAPENLVAAARSRLFSRQERAWGPLLFRLSNPSQLSACIQAEN